jgi:antitoxin component YwqK of YwqJK toxin-antitoxin module
MRWIFSLGLITITFCLNATTCCWIGDTLSVKVVIVEGDTSYNPKYFVDVPDTFIAFYDKDLRHKARWLYREKYFSRDSTWFSNGKLRSWYEQIPNCGPCWNERVWYSNGQIKQQSDCTKDTCAYIEYYTSGQIKKKDLNYVDSNAVGYRGMSWHYTSEYYENGQLKFLPGDPNSGKPHPYITYYPSGQKKEECIIHMPSLVGPYTAWYENGNVHVIGQYTIPEPEEVNPKTYITGKWSFYSESGKLIKEEFYEEGKLVKTVEY